jgi:thymidylate kinase
LAGSYARGCSKKTLELAETIISDICLPSTIIWLKTDVDIAFKRIKERGYDLNSIEYLEKFDNYLEKLSKKYSFTIINGNESIPQVYKKVINSLTLLKL